MAGLFWKETKGLRQRFPVKLTDGEEEGFSKYAGEYYKSALQQAEQIAKGMASDDSGEDLLISVVFEKLASPAVYLLDKWRDLPPEQRKRYLYTEKELAEVEQKAKELTAKAAEALTQ